MTAAEDRILTVPEAAVLLGRSPAEVHELIEEGELRFSLTDGGKLLRVPSSAVSEFLKRLG